ncbi:MAG TPA: hypothetical protein VG708_11285 [Mycobacteriales bacterium]|nr:hypothetical protein [Mycobacteriales bacterium]
MRVYLPATLPLLRDWLEAGAATTSAGAYAVTPDVREWYRDGDLEELEHVAQVAAAQAALDLLADDPTAPRRRAVLAVDVADDAARPAPDHGRAAVTIAGPVERTRWASALVDDEAAALVVTAAVERLSAAAAGDPDAQFALDEAAAHDLGWYAVQELSDLLSAG